MQPRVIQTVVVVSSLLALSAGCRQQAIDDRADKEINAVRADSNELYRAASCPNGQVLGPRCGLVAVRAGMPDFRARFKTQQCEGLDEAACNGRLDAAVESWVTKRYNLAVVADVDRICEKDPDAAMTPWSGRS